MKKVAMIIIGIVVVVSVFVVSKEVMKMSLPKESAGLSILTQVLTEETDTYSIKLTYPEFSVPMVDQQVQRIIESAVNDFKSFPPNPTPIAAKNELIGSYRDAYISDEVLSARMDIYQFTGGAHGGTVAYGLNFHRDGTRYTLHEALELIGKDLGLVADEATKQLTERFGMVQFPEGATPTIENYATFLISSSTVTFMFQQYQVEAYAAGIPEIAFPRVK